MFPKDRQVPLESAAVYGCEEETVDTFLDTFVETLFPMAQGIAETDVHAYCLRFSMEWGKYVALLYTNFTSQLAQQKQQAMLWKRKCGSQVQLIALCQSMDIYQQNFQTPNYCRQPWTLDRPSSYVYITPQCLLAVQGVFYDPCLCNSSYCNNSAKVINVTRFISECPPVFNASRVVIAHELGWWDSSNNDVIALEHNNWIADPINLLLKDNLIQDTVTQPNGHFNTPLDQSWVTAEGYMQDNSVFCDFISDYWPDDSIFPVGFHVSLACMKEDIAFRSFDNVFAMDPIDAVLWFMEDQTRDVDLIASNFGAGGLCRLTNFGFDMYETNTMRLCTKTQSDDNIDVLVPRGKPQSWATNYMQCSNSSKDVPWTMGPGNLYYDASLYSVGTVPNMPTGGEVYPQQGYFFSIGNTYTGWGEFCEDMTPDPCNCASGFYCIQGVCMDNSVQCISHQDCTGNNMCNGVGQCVSASVNVWNNDTDDVEFRIHSANCGKDPSFSMLGGSSWGYVPDLLDAHGMCSYRHWREYLHTLDSCPCTSVSSSECRLRAENCTYYDFMIEDNPNLWWGINDAKPASLQVSVCVLAKRCLWLSSISVSVAKSVPGQLPE